MPIPSDPTPEPQGDALARIGDILANAEREVANVVAAAETAATDGVARIEDQVRTLDERSVVLDERAAELDLRGSELAELTAGILAAAADVQAYAQRLAALPPLPVDGEAPVAVPTDLPRLEPPLRPAPDDTHRAPEALPPRPRRAATPDVDPDPPASATPAALRAVASDVWAETAIPGTEIPRSVPAPAPVDPGLPEDLPIVAGSDTATDPPERLDSARLVALSMAAEGRSRIEVESHVRDTLGIIEHAALIDYVFGGSTPSSVVPSWPPRRRRRTS